MTRDVFRLTVLPTCLLLAIREWGLTRARALEHMANTLSDLLDHMIQNPLHPVHRDDRQLFIFGYSLEKMEDAVEAMQFDPDKTKALLYARFGEAGLKYFNESGRFSHTSFRGTQVKVERIKCSP